MKRRNLIIIIVICVVAVVAGIYVYNLLTKQEKVTEEGVITPVVGTEDIKLRLSEEEKREGKTIEEKEKEITSEQSPGRENFEDVTEVTIKKVIDQSLMSPTLSADKQRILFFSEELNEFYQAELDGSNPETITSAGFNNVLDIKWGNSKDKAVVSFAGDDQLSKRLIAFNLNDQSYNNLGQNVTEAAISPDGSKIVYLYVDEESDVSNLSTADFDGSKWKVIAPLKQNETKLLWPSQFRFVVSAKPTSFQRTSLRSMDATGQNVRTIIGDTYGITYRVSPDGNKIIYTSTIARGRSLLLFVSDIDGGNQKNLELQTSANKCAFAYDNKTVYCGVPHPGNIDYVVPDDYLEGKFVTEDSFYKIDIETGVKQKIADSVDFNFSYDVFDPFVSESGRAIYFERRQDKMLYALIMPQ